MGGTGTARGIAFLAAFLALSVMSVSTAFAVECHAVGSESGSETKHIGASGSSQFGAWQVNHSPYPRIRGEVVTGDLINNDRCQDVYLDWATEDDHFDARVVRNCRDDGYRQTGDGDGWKDEDQRGGRVLLGLQKAAACLYDISETTYIGDCINFDANLNGCDVDASDARGANNDNKGLAFWVRYGDGTTGFFDGGDAWSRTH